MSGGGTAAGGPQGAPPGAGRAPDTASTLRIRGSVSSVSPSLRAGDTVTVNVLRPAGPGTWTVLLGGRTLTAQSTVPLQKGAVLAARVERTGSGFLLRLLPPDADMARMLADARLPSDALSQAAARALIRSGLGVTADRLEQMRAAARGSEEGLLLRLRSAAEALKKLPGLSAEDLELLCRVMSSGDGSGSGGRRGRRDRRKQRPRDDAASTGPVEAGEDASAVKAATPGAPGEVLAGVLRSSLWGTGGADREDPSATAHGAGSSRAADLLRFYNHRRVSDQSWVILPCRFRDSAGAEISGSVRVLYDSVTRTIRSLVVGLAAKGGPWWWFRIAPGDSGTACRIYSTSSDAAHRARSHLAELRAQLDKVGVRVADTVADGTLFDGFSLVGPEDPRPVDLLS